MTRRLSLNHVQHRRVERQRVLSLGYHVSSPDLTRCVDQAATALHAAVLAAGGEVSGPCMVTYHGPVSGAERGPVEITLPYTGELAFGEAGPPPGMEQLEHPPRVEAFVRLLAAEVNPQMADAACQVTRRYASDNGVPARFPHEYYYPRPQPDGTLAEVAWPFRWRNQLEPAASPLGRGRA